MQLHNRLADLRARKARLEHRVISISEISREVHLPRNSVKRWLKDEIGLFDGLAVTAICLYLPCRLDELLFLK